MLSSLAVKHCDSLLCLEDEQLLSLALPGAAISSGGGDGVSDCGLEDPENGC